MIAESFIKTITNQMIKSEIAKYLAARWEEKVDFIRDWISVSDKENVSDIINEFSSIEKCLTSLENQSQGKEYGIGFPSVDASVKLRKKDVVILGAYSFAGKTDLLIEWVLHWIIREKLRILVFSLEMDEASFVERIVYKLIGCNSSTLPPDFDTADIKEKLSKYLYVIDKNGLSMDDIEKRIHVANTHIFDEPVDVAAVDFFGYVKGTDDFSSASTQARRMKEIAKKWNLLFVMLSQFARTSQHSDKGKVREPMLYDLKLTGDLESSADEVFLAWRPVLNTPDLSEIDRERLKYLTYIKIAKARRGIKAGTHFELEYQPQTSRLREKQNETMPV